MKTKPFFWVRKIASELQQYNQIPLFGNAPPFDWEAASSALSTKLNAKIEISPVAQQLRTAEEIQDGVGDNPLVIPLKAGPFDGSAYWICPRSTVAKFTKPLSEPDLAEGYYRYLLLQVLDTLSTLEPFQTVSFVLSEGTPLPQTDAYCIDLEIQYNDETLWGRLAIDPELKRSWALHHSQSPKHFQHSATELIVGVKVGAIKLSQAEWKSLQPGDFVLLDKSGYNPRKHEGAAYLMLRETPLFEVKIKHNKLELIDYPHTYEEMMKENIPPKESLQLPPAEEFAEIKDLPIYITIELARYRITLEKLMQLSPGNQLELPLHPSQSANLTVNGQLIGHGEVISLGDTLGVRILDLGK